MVLIAMKIWKMLAVSMTRSTEKKQKAPLYGMIDGTRVSIK